MLKMNRSGNNRIAEKYDAVARSQAVIEFTPDGEIVTANQNFLDAMGYTLGEIRGQHHAMFVEEGFAETQAYRDFWDNLRRGEAQVAEFKRIGKGGRPVWIQASYNPVVDASGRTTSIVKFATDVTDRKLADAEVRGKLDALDKSQAIIEFDLDGTIQTANKNFLDTMGYALEEVSGQHHRIFVAEEDRDTPDYKEFWARLARGEF